MLATLLLNSAGFLTILIYYASAQGLMQCLNPLGKFGNCKNIRQCPPLLKILIEESHLKESVEFLRASVCGHEGTDPRLCCPNEDTNSNDRVNDDKPANTTYHALAPPICGKSNGKFDRVVGGVPATLGTWPWVVALGYRSQKDRNIPLFLCGGSLITARHVITAGHCVYHRSDLYLARLGDLDLYNDDDGADPIELLIEKKILHPEYSPTSYTNDIAVLRLEEEVPFTDNLHPICLPVPELVQNSLLNVDKAFPFIAGWGSIYFNGPSSSKLLELQLPVVKESKCKDVFKSFTNAVIDNRTVCAGFIRGGKDACRGDSGGPLMLPLKATYYLIGVVSYGYGCAQAGYPGVYSRVTTFLNFILNNLN